MKQYLSRAFFRLLFLIAGSFLLLLATRGVSFSQDVKDPFKTLTPSQANRYAYTNLGLWVDSLIKFTRYKTIGIDTAILGFDTAGHGIRITKSMIALWGGSGGGGSTLTLGYGLTGTSYNGSTAVTTKVDTTTIASISRVNNSVGGIVTLYNGNGTLSANRTITGGNHTLTFTGMNNVSFHNSNGDMTFGSGGDFNVNSTAFSLFSIQNTGQLISITKKAGSGAEQRFTIDGNIDTAVIGFYSSHINLADGVLNNATASTYHVIVRDSTNGFEYKVPVSAISGGGGNDSLKSITARGNRTNDGITQVGLGSHLKLDVTHVQDWPDSNFLEMWYKVSGVPHWGRMIASTTLADAFAQSTGANVQSESANVSSHYVGDASQSIELNQTGTEIDMIGNTTLGQAFLNDGSVYFNNTTTSNRAFTFFNDGHFSTQESTTGNAILDVNNDGGFELQKPGVSDMLVIQNTGTFTFYTPDDGNQLFRCDPYFRYSYQGQDILQCDLDGTFSVTGNNGSSFITEFQVSADGTFNSYVNGNRKISTSDDGITIGDPDGNTAHTEIDVNATTNVITSYARALKFSSDAGVHLDTLKPSGVNNNMQFPNLGGTTLRYPAFRVNGTFADNTGNVTVSVGTGTVTNVSSANGDATVANQTTIPVITIVSAPKLTTARTIYGNSFDGTAILNQIIASTYGGTGNGFTKFSGPASTEKTFALPNASATILTDNAAVTVAQGGTGLATLTANNVVLGNGTSTPNFVAPGTSGNVLTSNGTTWASTAAASGGVTTVGSFNATSTANVADISSSIITIHAADGTNPGAVTTGTQTIAGAKTFSTSITTPVIAGGSGTTSTLTLKPTTGVGTTNADLIFAGGNNGGTEYGRFVNGGNLVIGATGSASTYKFNVGATNQFVVLPDNGGGGERPAGTVLFGTASGNLAFFADINGGTVGKVTQFGYFNGGYLSAFEIANVSSGFGTALLMKSGGSVAIGNTSAAATAVLDITSTAKGMLIPRMTNTQMAAISSPATGLLLVNTDAKMEMRYDGSAYKSASVISGSFTGTGTATTVYTVTFGGTQPNTTYKVTVTPTNVLSTALLYVTNKTTTTFDVTYLAGLTGAVAFDYTVSQ